MKNPCILYLDTCSENADIWFCEKQGKSSAGSKHDVAGIWGQYHKRRNMKKVVQENLFSISKTYFSILSKYVFNFFSSISSKYVFNFTQICFQFWANISNVCILQDLCVRISNFSVSNTRAQEFVVNPQYKDFMFLDSQPFLISCPLVAAAALCLSTYSVSSEPADPFNFRLPSAHLYITEYNKMQHTYPPAKYNRI